MRKIITLFLQTVICCTLISVVTTSVYADESKISVIINGENVPFTEDSGFPYVDENYRTMVPLRVTMETAGASVGYDPAAKTAIVVLVHDRIEVPLGTNYLYNNNVKIPNDTIAVAKNNRTYLPIRAVLESAGYTVEWNAKANAVIANNFPYDSDNLVPYDTSSLETLVRNILRGNVVCINGQYYATPDFIKTFRNEQVVYLGDDLNTAIYPQKSKFDPANISTVEKDWVTLADLSELDIDFQVLSLDRLCFKGFYHIGLTGISDPLYKMPSLPDDFLDAPYSGTFDGIQIKVEGNELLFKQDDLIAHGVLTERIKSLAILQP